MSSDADPTQNAFEMAARTPRNLILCADGTGNSGGKTRGTNVWRLYNAVDRHSTSPEQLVFYHDGVGTEDDRWRKMFGGAFGWGLSRNIIDLYSILVRHYRQGDRIHLFGFSRGAFTVRALAGMVCACGLWNREQFIADPEREKTIRSILHAYRAPPAEAPSERDPDPRDRQAEALKALRLQGLQLRDVPIHFIGVWDTVDAVGVPIDEMRDALDPIWLFLVKRRAYGFHDSALSSKVTAAAQALAIDDERKTFHPNVWLPRQGIEQVWFAGAHSNVGGGYPKDGMSHVTLDWMMGKARDLVLRPGARREVQEQADVHARLYDSRAGVAVYYRYEPRNLDSLCRGQSAQVHTSVFERAWRGTADYAPKLPAHTEVAATAGGGPYSLPLSAPAGAPRPPALDAEKIQEVWALVARRRRLYRVFVVVNVVVAALVVWGLLLKPQPAWAVETLLSRPWLAWLDGAIERFATLALPDFATQILRLVKAYPIPAAVAVAVMVGIRLRSSALIRSIQRASFAAWSRARGDLEKTSSPTPAA